MKLFKYILSFLLLAFLSYQNTYAQSDTTEINQSGYFLTFVKKVYLNPTVYLRTQDFKENTNLSFVALPDLASDKTNASSGFEKGLQKVLRFLMQSDGGVRFYFNPDSTTNPFRFWYSDNLHCKFKQADKDSIDYYLNHNFADGNISMTNALRFETTIDKALDYIEKCLTANPQACGEEPQNETTEINTKPLSVSLHNRANSKYDIDVKQYERLESNYAKAFDIHTQQDWYAPAKLLVANETAEPVALAIHSNEGDFLKQNIKIEILKTHALLPIDQVSTEDSLFFSLPSSLPSSDPVEVIVKYKSPKDSLTYTVGFFMVNVMARKTKNLVLIPANGFVVSPEFRDSVENELEKIYGQASIDFNVTIETGLAFPSEYPTTIEIESSGLISNYAPDLRDYVGEIINLNNYESDNYYLVIGLETSELDGYMPRARNIGFIFKGAVNKPKVVTHEIGHGAFHFRHIFAEEELGKGSLGTTQNMMDYVSNPKDLYLHQWNFIKEPAFVSWFGGDDEEAQAKGDVVKIDSIRINSKDTLYIDFDNLSHKLTIKNINRSDSLSVKWYINNNSFPTDKGQIEFNYQMPIFNKMNKLEAKFLLTDSVLFSFYIKCLEGYSLTVKPIGAVRNYLFDDTYNFSTDSTFKSKYPFLNNNDTLPRIPLIGVLKDSVAEFYIPKLFSDKRFMYSDFANFKLEAEKSGYVLFNDKSVLELYGSEYAMDAKIKIKPIKYTGDQTNFNSIRINIKTLTSNKIVGAFDLICLPRINKTIHLVHVKAINDTIYPTYLSKANSENFLNNQSLSQLFCNMKIIEYKLNLNLTSDSVKTIIWNKALSDSVKARTTLYNYLHDIFLDSINKTYAQLIPNTKTSTLFFVTNFDFDFFENIAAYHWYNIGKGLSLARCIGAKANYSFSHELGHWFGFPHTFESNANHPICINPIKNSTENYMDYFNTRINWSKTQLILVK